MCCNCGSAAIVGFTFMHHHSHSNHAHAHGHGLSSGNPIAWAFFLNLVFTLIEIAGGLLTNSTAIMADAVHDLGDTLAIGLAWWLQSYSKKAANQTFTYGYRRFSLLAALINGAILVAGSVWVLSMAIPRLSDPVMPHAEGMLYLALLGVGVNGYAAYRLSKGRTLNERSLNWHLLEDVAGWVAVLIVSITLQFYDWPILDPLLSIVFTLFIAFNIVRVLKTTAGVFFQATPDHDVYTQVHERLVQLDNVRRVHGVHLWSLDGERHVLTVHVQLEEELGTAQLKGLKSRIALTLQDFNLAHTTIELEFPDEPCRDHYDWVPEPRSKPVAGGVMAERTNTGPDAPMK